MFKLAGLELPNFFKNEQQKQLKRSFHQNLNLKFRRLEFYWKTRVEITWTRRCRSGQARCRTIDRDDVATVSAALVVVVV